MADPWAVVAEKPLGASRAPTDPWAVVAEKPVGPPRFEVPRPEVNVILRDPASARPQPAPAASPARTPAKRKGYTDYARQRRDSAGEMIKQGLGLNDTGDTLPIEKQLGNAASLVGGAFEYAASPVAAAVDRVVGQPIETLTRGAYPAENAGDVFNTVGGFFVPGAKGPVSEAVEGPAVRLTTPARPAPAARPPGPIARAAAPFMAKVSPAAAEEQAARVIAERATDLPAVKASLAKGPEEIVPGSKPTTLQQTGDMGLGSLEREVATRNPAEFTQRRAEQNTAHVGALEDIQAGAHPEDVAKFFKSEFERLDAAHDGAVSDATQQARASTERLGGTGTPESYGEAIRTPIAEADQAAAQQLNALYKTVDPHRDMTANAEATRAGAKEVMDELRPTSLPMSADVAATFKAASEMPALAPLQDIIELQKRVNAQLRAELRSPTGKGPDYARLSRLRGAIQDNLSNTIAHHVALDDAAVARGSMAPEEALSARLRAKANDWSQPDEVRARTAVGGNPGAADSAGAAAGVPGLDRAGVPQGSGPRGPAGDTGLPAAQPSVGAVADVKAAGKPDFQSLFAAVRKLGGIKTHDAQGAPLAGPDVGAALTDVKVPGLINNKGGKSPEYMAQALADAGWFGPNVEDASAAFEAALSRQARGEKVFHPEHVERTDQARRAINDEMRAAGVEANDNAGIAAKKLSEYRAAKTDLAKRAEAAGVKNPDRMSVDELLTEVQEREAIQAEGGADLDPHGAEFDRLLTSRRPTADREAVGRLAEADAAAKAKAQTFKVKPVDAVLKRGATNDQFAMADGSVPGQFFRPGPLGFQSMQAALKAAPEALPVLEDYAASSLRRVAMREDGTIDPAKFATWRKNHQEALRALPEATLARFSDAASAGQAVADAGVARAAALKEAQTGAAARIMSLTEPQDVTRTIGSILSGRTSVSDIKALAAKARGNLDAKAGLRQAIADHILEKLVGNTEVGASGVTGVKADAFQTFMRRNRTALAEVFSPAEITSMENVAASIQRAKRSETAVKLPGGSNTAQDLMGARKGLVRVGLRSLLDTLAGILGHSVGGTEGALAGAVGADFIQGLRAAGIERVDQLVTRAMLDPEVARALLAKIPETSGKGSPARTTVLRLQTATLLRALGVGVAVSSATSTASRPAPIDPQPNALAAPKGSSGASMNALDRAH